MYQIRPSYLLFMNRLCLVTNATAKSICRYILAYLKEQNLSDERILEIKKKLYTSVELDYSDFSIEKLLESFNDKNYYFLELFNFLREDNRYLLFLKTLQEKGKIPLYFRNVNSVDKLYDSFYNRIVFHTSVFCDFINHDYIEGPAFEQNTGVFAEKIIQKEKSFYKVNEEYLSNLNLRECKVCKNLHSNAFKNLITHIHVFKKFEIAVKTISMSYDILIDGILNRALIKLHKDVIIEVFLNKEQWLKLDINQFLQMNLVLRLTHQDFAFYNNIPFLVIDNELYFYKSRLFYIPNQKIINTSAFNLLKNNTISLSNDRAINAKYAYYVPVKHINYSENELVGQQSIVELNSYGLSGFLILKCHFSYVPESIYGFWESKLNMHTNGNLEFDFDHNYFGFTCLDPTVMEYL